MTQTATPPMLAMYRKFSRYPRGNHLFTRAVCFKAPYFASIRPLIVDLQPGRCEVRIRKRRAVLNHLGTVHAIAMCNMAELAGGMMSDVTVPATHRWIPKGMTVEYLKKAETDLTAVGRMEDETPFSSTAGECPVLVEVQDTAGETVFRARITMWVSPKKNGK